MRWGLCWYAAENVQTTRVCARGFVPLTWDPFRSSQPITPPYSKSMPWSIQKRKNTLLKIFHEKASDQSCGLAGAGPLKLYVSIPRCCSSFDDCCEFREARPFPFPMSLAILLSMGPPASWSIHFFQPIIYPRYLFSLSHPFQITLPLDPSAWKWRGDQKDPMLQRS